MFIAPLFLAAALAAPSDTARSATPADAPALHMEVHRLRRTITLELGPITLPTTDGYNDPAPPFTAAGTWGVDGWLQGFRIEILDAEGRALDVPILHHAALIAPDQRDLFGPMARRIVAFGQETTPIPLPRRLGYRIHPTDSLRLVAVLFNSGDAPLEGVRLRMTVDYAFGRLDGERWPILPFLLNAAGKGGFEFDVPPGGVRQSWDWSPAVPGRIIALGGHLHAYATAVLFEDVTDGKLLWTGRPIYGDDGEVEGVTRKAFLRAIRIRPDHRYRVTAVYENPTGEVIRGAMGHVGGLFMPDGDAEIPPLDRADPDYIAEAYIATMGEHMHHHSP